MHIQCLQARTVQVGLWTQNIHCKACWQLTPFHLWMSVPTLYLLSMLRHDDSVLFVALHGTPMDFCHEELIFWCTDTSALWTSMSEWSCQYCNIYSWNTCVLMHMYPYMTGTLHVHGACFQTYVLHFLFYHTVDQKLVAMTYGGPICMYVYVCTCVFACVYQPCPQSLPGQVLNHFLPTTMCTKFTTWYCALIVKFSITVF